MKARIRTGATRVVLFILVFLAITMPTGAESPYGIVLLSPVTPSPALVAGGDIDVVFTRLDFVVATQDIAVQELTISRSGDSADTDLVALKLYDWATRLGPTQTLCAGKATFGDLNWVIPAHSTKTLTIKADIAPDAEVGHTIQLGIASSSDITSTLPFSGDFPIMGAPMEVVAEETPVFLSFLPLVVREP